jgi:hypothetical protein
VRDVQSSWFGGGSDVLSPLYKKNFVVLIDKFKPKDVKKKCSDQAVMLWDKVQEATTKVLNAADANDQKAMAMVFHDMFTNMLKVVSFLNQTPYTSYAKLIPESQKMARPRDFPELTKIAINGEFGNFARIRKTVANVFSEFENELEGLGYKLYQDNIDPGKPINYK